MTASFGKITAHLAEPIDKIPDELIALINQNIKPLQPISADDVFVRAMFVVSDEINSFGGRFPVDEHTRLASLLIDSPVLVGHRKDKLPIGRNFHAALITKDGRQWVKSYFYWLKSSEGAESLRENIDGGIYKECSIGFTYLFPECSVCGHDIRRCDHQPLSKLVINGEESTIHFNYRQIEKVLETSLVYRGALPDTSVTKELDHSKPLAPGFLKIPFETANNRKNEYQLEQYAETGAARIRISGGDRSSLFVIRQFNINRLRHGARFVAEVLSSTFGLSNLKDSPSGFNILGKGEVEAVTRNSGQIVLHLNGILEGKYVLRPVKLDGIKRLLFYKFENQVGQLQQRRFEESGHSQGTILKGETCQ